MDSRQFLDTNVLIYATMDQGARSAVARELLSRRPIISVQVLNEFTKVAVRKLRRPWAEVEQALGFIRSLCAAISPIALGTHEAAVIIAKQTGYRFYDALIVASALEAGCSELLTEDMQNGRTIEDRLTIRNPFATAPPREP